MIVSEPEPILLPLVCEIMFLHLLLCGVDLNKFLNVRLWFARRARDLARGIVSWSSAPLLRPPLRALRTWVSLLQENKPATLVKAPPVSAVVHMDACAELVTGVKVLFWDANARW